MEEVSLKRMIMALVFQTHAIYFQGENSSELLKNIIVWLHKNPMFTVLSVETNVDYEATICYIDTGEHID